MAYPNPERVIFQSDGKFDWGGNADGTLKIVGLPGMTMRIDKIHFQITEEFANDTTVAKLQFGDGTDADKYGELSIADGEEVGSKWYTREGGDFALSSDLDNGGDHKFDPDTEITVTFKRGADAAAIAGQAHVTIYGECF